MKIVTSMLATISYDRVTVLYLTTLLYKSQSIATAFPWTGQRLLLEWELIIMQDLLWLWYSHYCKQIKEICITQLRPPVEVVWLVLCKFLWWVPDTSCKQHGLNYGFWSGIQWLFILQNILKYCKIDVNHTSYLIWAFWHTVNDIHCICISNNYWWLLEVAIP